MEDPYLLVANQFGAAVGVTWVLEKLKLSNYFPGIRIDTDKLNRFIGVMLALLTAAGFKFAYEGNFELGGVLTIHIPSSHELTEFLFSFLRSLGFQEAYYRVALKPRTTYAEVQASNSAAASSESSDSSTLQLPPTD